MSDGRLNLIADIGGTNIRLALTQSTGEISAIETYRCAEYESLSDVLLAYLEKQQVEGKSLNACLAIACPVENDEISMTNLPWKFSQSKLKRDLNLDGLFLINDYTAIAHAIPLLTDEQKVQIGEGAAIDNKPISVCGPGTGLGVANLVYAKDSWHCISGEGGHIDFAPVDQDEIQILSYLMNKKEHRISYEQLLSGKGLEQIYQALVAKDELGYQDLSAEAISAKALDDSCPVCQQALSQFCKTLGSFAGDLAMIMGSFGGVYIAGGIVPRFIDFLSGSDFRARFQAKGRLSSFIEDIPTYVITEPQPGLLGASAYLRQHNKEES